MTIADKSPLLFHVKHLRKEYIIMDITLYLNRSQRNVVNKVLSHEKTLSDVFLLEECEVLKPTLIFAKTDDTIFDTYNYVFIPKFNRYYYATIELLDAERYRLTCDVDVLMSFKDDIYGASVEYSRSTQNNNKLVPDTQILNSVKKIQTIREFKNHEFLSVISADNISMMLVTL